jgi:uncharacterized protein GlcG (DUF336 family)
MAKMLGLAEARAVVDAILKVAGDRNLKFAAAVVDEGGELIYLHKVAQGGAIMTPHYGCKMLRKELNL